MNHRTTLAWTCVRADDVHIYFPATPNVLLSSSNTTPLFFRLCTMDDKKGAAAVNDANSMGDHQNRMADGQKSYADAAGWEARTFNDFPTVEEQREGHYIPTDIQGLSAPNPHRSYGDVAGNKGFPTVQESAAGNKAPLLQQQKQEHLPTATEMLQPAARAPPTSYAKVAAKPVVQLEEQLDREQDQTAPPLNGDIPNSSAREPRSLSLDDIEAFPSLSPEPSHGSSPTRSNGSPPLSRSYAQATHSNLDKAPPPAKAHVDASPTYNEDQFLKATSQRETRKMKQLEQSGQWELVTPEMQDRLQVEQEQTKPDEAPTTAAETLPQFSVFNTIAVLREQGYSWLTSVPVAVFMHLYYSPRTSPHGFPLPYRSLRDLATLPIYTTKLKACLASSDLVLLHQSKSELQDTVNFHGKRHGRVTGLSYQDGLSAIQEKDATLSWWRVKTRLAHRLQWTLVFMTLEDPNAHLVTIPSLLAIQS
ncbi:hypothetical protein BC940DRAFT_297193 [Gongronella butleri]|nr:hypothetical protein BC940DRAFT_297193 [Gongronella butleri]